MTTENENDQPSQLVDGANSYKDLVASPENSNVTLSAAITSPVPDTDEAKRLPTVPMLRVSTGDYESLAMAQKIEPPTLDKTKRQTDWDVVHYGAARNAVQSDVIYNALKRPASDWQQGVAINGYLHSFEKPRVGDTQKVQTPTATATRTYMNAKLGIGSVVNLTLPGSGVMLTVSIPQLTDLANHQYAFAAEKHLLGVATDGLIYASDGVLIEQKFVDFLRPLILGCNVQINHPSEILDFLPQTDLQIIAQQLAVAMYPRGYRIVSPCLIDVNKCNATTEELISPAKMLLIDNAVFTPFQLKIYSERNTLHTLEQIQKYIDEASDTPQRTTQIIEGVRVVWRIPTIRESLDMGLTWVNEITQNIEKMFSSAPFTVRTKIAEQHQKQTALRMYGHWVKEIQIDEQGATITDPAQIAQNLNDFCGSEDVVIKLMNGVAEYITSITRAVVGVQQHQCHNCKGWKVPNNPDKASIIPVDPVKVFFTLRDQRLQKMM